MKEKGALVRTTNFLLCLFIFSLFISTSDAEAKKRRRKKEKEANPDIRCKLDVRQNSERQLIEVRLAKLVRNKNGKVQTSKISAETGEGLCKSFSQILWKKLVEGKAEKNCAEPVKVYVRGKNHNICLEDSEKVALDEGLAAVEKALSENP